MSTKKQGNRISQGMSRMRKLVADLPFIGAGPKGGNARALQAKVEKAGEKAESTGKMSR